MCYVQIILLRLLSNDKCQGCFIQDNSHIHMEVGGGGITKSQLGKQLDHCVCPFCSPHYLKNVKFSFIIINVFNYCNQCTFLNCENRITRQRLINGIFLPHSSNCNLNPPLFPTMTLSHPLPVDCGHLCCSLRMAPKQPGLR